ncbi:hypothetical protein RJT34_20434 [Clitoria ternatea]|uniref:Uncharacterized protein n=1 Tax=Clitoria ternatea TaxID=43366 RepID=A0AAN9IT76_CLITE
MCYKYRNGEKFSLSLSPLREQRGLSLNSPKANWHSTVPAWEKKFCASVGSVPWRKLIHCKKYMDLHDKVMDWDDSAVKEAFDNAKSRFWADINGLPCNISLPDPDMYIDDVDSSAEVDPELILDLERARKVPAWEEKEVECVLLGNTLFVNQKPFPPTGWGVDEAEAPKPFDPSSAGWGYLAEYDYPKPEDSWHQWNEQHAGGDVHKVGRGRNGGNGNWGTWDGYNRKREDMSWSKTHHAYGGNENRMNRGGRRNYRGGRSGNFGYDRPYYVEKVPSPAAW